MNVELKRSNQKIMKRPFRKEKPIFAVSISTLSIFFLFLLFYGICFFNFEKKNLIPWYVICNWVTWLYQVTYCNLANFATKKVAVRSNFTLFKVLTQYIFCEVLHAEENGSDNFVKKRFLGSYFRNWCRTRNTSSF